MASISGMLPENSSVMRNGASIQVPASQLVPGDIVDIKMGTRVPADIRFLECSKDAKFDRSILTGESKPLPGSAEACPSHHNYLDANCIGLQGSYCVMGKARGIVVSTGDETVFGRVAKLSSVPKRGLSPLQKEVLRFIIIICTLVLLIIILVIIVWAAWLRRSHPDWINVPNLIIDLVSVAVAFIPEGLPVALTTCLIITANAMKNQRILCKNLSTVETLGSVSVLCSDKTGTLTKNQMTVTTFSLGPEGNSLSSLEEFKSSKKDSLAHLMQLQAVASLCNASYFDADNKVVAGDATDQAIYQFANSIKPVTDSINQWTTLSEIPFNSTNKFMATIQKPNSPKAMKEGVGFSNNGMDILFIKGAPDILLKMCTTYVSQKNASVTGLDENTFVQVQDLQNKWSTQGKRVILLARKALDSTTSSLLQSDPEENIQEVLQTGLTLVGLVGLVDPPRDEVPNTIATIREAGIRVFMITGDYSNTAVAIAKQCGIVTCGDEDVQSMPRVPIMFSETPSINGKMQPFIQDRAMVVSGPEIAEFGQQHWDMLFEHQEIVFARTTPEQKLSIVLELQKRKCIVAMTGDGVNDAPSLKAADIGVAMGNGSDVAMEAADLVLLDSFGSIVEAIKYGRLVFDNLKKTIIYLLPAGTWSELWAVLLSIFFGMPQILSSFLMIVICCLTDCAGAISLAYEKPERDLLRLPPRSITGERLVNGKMIFHAYLIIGVYECLCAMIMAFWFLQRSGIPFTALSLSFGNIDVPLDSATITLLLNRASSIYFVTLVIMQFFNLLSIRTRRLSILQQPPFFRKQSQNLWILVAFAFAIAIIFIFNYIPSLQRIINSATIPVEHFFIPLGLGMGLLLIDEARKYFIRKYPYSFLAKVAW